MTLLRKFALLSLVVTLLIGILLGAILERQIEAGWLDQAATDTAEHVHHLVTPFLREDDFKTPLSPERYLQLDRYVNEKVLSQQVVRVKVWNKEAVIVYSDERELVGQAFPSPKHLEEALQGAVVAHLSSLTEPEHIRERGRFPQLIEIYAPIFLAQDSEPIGVFEIYQDSSELQTSLQKARWMLWGSLGAGLVLLYGSLFTIVRNASRTLVQQNIELQQLTENLQQSLEELDDTYHATLESLSAALDARDHETEGHSKRVTSLTVAIARAMGVPESELLHIEWGSLLHDVGKIGVSDTILLKPGPLTPAEWEEMRRHPEIGYRMLRGVKFLEGALSIVLYHHERYDGKGYPRGLKDSEIPLGARIFAVADAYDAMTSPRPYRPARTKEEALAEIQQGAGTQFDPEVVEHFLKVIDRQTIRVRELT